MSEYANNLLAGVAAAQVAKPAPIECESPANEPNKPAPKFIAKHESVCHGERVVARAISKTMAKRIANALNNHKVNSEGV